MRKLTLIIQAAWLAHSLSAGEYHVSVTGSDASEGSASWPFKTISAAALRAQPGDVITVHEGIYRERIDPPRGGESDTSRIVYQAAQEHYALGAVQGGQSQRAAGRDQCAPNGFLSPKAGRQLPHRARLHPGKRGYPVGAAYRRAGRFARDALEPGVDYRSQCHPPLEMLGHRPGKIR
ncbi:MAG: DUF1565 domain-containing protein [Verrucomicrobiota bacterium]